RGKLIVLSLMVSLFFVGGVTGAYSFFHFGFGSTWPLALLLTLLAVVPIADDVRSFIRRA
ncbi:MAG: DUF1275 domain-containing protein, partial [Achromobacter pestifer]